MSKMPAKKKSCFQITSVTQAQVAGNSITDDTESLDDPDESRTEDVSSEIFDMSRTDLVVCDRSFSEEALNNVGEHQDGPAPVNGVLTIKSIGTGGRNTPHNLGGSVPVPAATQPIVPATSQPVSVSSSGAPTSCNSRFRVIKLDHGTGEPFRRGRWTCTEFYDKDSDSNRTVDSVKPTMTHELSIDRDSGLGAISNSVAAPCSFTGQALDNTDIRCPTYSSQSLLQGSSLSSQIGSGASAFQPTGYATATSQQAQVSLQPVVSQTFIHNSLNGVHQGAMLQKSPVMPPTTQPHQLAYSNIGMSSGQTDYRPQHFGTSTQSIPPTSLPVVPPSSQGPLITPAGPIGLGLLGQGGDSAVAPGLHLQAGSASAVAPVSQTQPLGGLGITAASPVTINSQNVPATVPTATTVAPGWTAMTGGPVSSNFNNQSEDSRPMSDALPQSISIVASGKDAVKPFITEGLSFPTSTVSLFGITIPVDGDDDSASGASVVAIDNKIEQAMDLVKNHLMYAVREEVEVLKEQIKELYERNSVLERENAVLKSLANSEQLNQLSSQLSQVNSVILPQQQHSFSTNNSNALGHYEAVQSVPHQPNITSA